VFDVLVVGFVRCCFGFSDFDFEIIIDWVEEVGICWVFDVDYWELFGF